MRSNRYCPFASRCNRRTRPDGSLFLCCWKPFVYELWFRSQTIKKKKKRSEIKIFYSEIWWKCVCSHPVWSLLPPSSARLIGVWLTSWPLDQLEPVGTGCIFTQRNDSGWKWIFSLCESPSSSHSDWAVRRCVPLRPWLNFILSLSGAVTL